MRLRHLAMSGFGAFREEVELDFDDVDFFALVGPTGAGKSTVIDAVCFALYGSVPRYDNKALVRYVVTLGASEAKVCLRFQLGGDDYIATRVVRRNAKTGAVSHKEARLEKVVPDGPTEVLAGTERELTDAVVALLGLSFDDFTRCVALPQGEFARFLRAKGDERRDLLIRLLNLNVYLEIGARARRLAEAAAAEIQLERRRLDALAFATPEARAVAEERATRVATLQREAQELQPVLTQLAERERAATQAAALARASVERLRAIDVPEAVRALAAEREAALGQVTSADAALVAAQQERESAESALRELPEIDPLRAALRAHEDLATCVTRLAEGDKQIAAATEEVEAAAREVAHAEAELLEAERQRDEAHRTHLAESLASHLVEGEPCPVCLQEVAALPRRPVAPPTEAADRAVVEKRNALESARKVAAQRSEHLAKLNGLASRLRDEKSEHELRVASHPDRASLEALIQRVEQAAALVEAMRNTEAASRRAHAASLGALKAIDERVVSAQSSFDLQRDAVVGLSPPTPSRVNLLSDWDALREWARDQLPIQEAAAIAADAEAASLAKKRAEKLDGLRDRFQAMAVALPGTEDVVAYVAAAASAASEASRVVADIDAAMQEAADLVTAIEERGDQAEVAAMLGNLLKADNFPEWLVEEALQLLVIDASDTLRRLTNNQYSLALGGKEFVVVDHANADEVRPARTLSGGETFQASLSLALALSQQIRNLAAEGAPRLDSIFLDEGFGTLDPETLDTVADTIETLGQSGRMVGIITHVQELAGRVPVRYEVTKGPHSSRIERKAL